MCDLISRQAAIDAICEHGTDLERRGITVLAMVEHKQLTIDLLEDLPSAQPEIIRCKECENWDVSWQNDDEPNYHYCPLADGMRRGDFYCADAEMRGEKNDT